MLYSKGVIGMNFNDTASQEFLGHIGAFMASVIIVTMAITVGHPIPLAIFYAIPVYCAVYFTRVLWLLGVYFYLFLKLIVVLGQ